MQKQPKALPFVVLIHGPKVVHPCCIERTADKTISDSCCYLCRFCKLEIFSYDFPICCLVSYCERGCINHSTYLETRMSKVFRRNVRSSSVPAFGYITLRSAIGPAMVSNVWPCERALVRPSSFTYAFSFVFLIGQFKTHKTRQKKANDTLGHKNLCHNAF